MGRLAVLRLLLGDQMMQFQTILAIILGAACDLRGQQVVSMSGHFLNTQILIVLFEAVLRRYGYNLLM